MSKSLSLLIASTAALSHAKLNDAETADALVKKLLTSAHDVHLPSKFLPDQWTSLKYTPHSSKTAHTMSPLSVQPTGYFIANQYSGSSDCSTANSFKYATGTGVCFVGMTNNTASGSLAYEFMGVGGGYFILNQAIWESLDCSGTPVVNTMPIPTTCLPNEDGDGTSVAYTYSVGSTPWTGYEPGLMFQDYDTKDHCADGGVGGLFAYFPMNSCIKSDEGGSFYFSSCDLDNGLYSIIQFADDKCSDFIVGITTKLQDCVYQDSTDEEMNPYTYTTYTCN